MPFFWYELWHFTAFSIGLAGSFGLAILFIARFLKERKQFLLYRFFAFSCFSVAFLLFIVEDPFPFFLPLPHFLELGGIFLILLSQYFSRFQRLPQKAEEGVRRAVVVSSGVGVLFLCSIVFGLPYELAVLLAAVCFALGALYNQLVISRDHVLRHGFRMHERFVVYFHIALVVRFLAFFILALPQSNIVFFHTLTDPQQFFDYLSLLSVLLGFSFVLFWGWRHVVEYPSLYRFISVFGTSLITAAVAAFLFLLFVFSSVEQQSIAAVGRSAAAAKAVIEDSVFHSRFVAEFIAQDPEVILRIRDGNYEELREGIAHYVATSNTDSVVVFNKYGERIVGGVDWRLEQTLAGDDPILAYVLLQKAGVITYDAQLNGPVPLLVGRSLYPIVDEGELLGAVEVMHVFDDAFIDAFKDELVFDISIYVGNIRSVTMEVDGYGNSLQGTQIIQDEIVQRVFEEGHQIATSTRTALGASYIAFVPLMDIYGNAVGAVSTSALISDFFVDVRQRLQWTFLGSLFTAFVFSVFGYAVIELLQREKSRLGV